MANGLKSCPFCGKEVCIEYDECFLIKHLDEKFDCVVDYVYFYNLHSLEEVKNKWNTRLGDHEIV